MVEPEGFEPSSSRAHVRALRGAPDYQEPAAGAIAELMLRPHSGDGGNRTRPPLGASEGGPQGTSPESAPHPQAWSGLSYASNVCLDEGVSRGQGGGHAVPAVLDQETRRRYGAGVPAAPHGPGRAPAELLDLGGAEASAPPAAQANV